MALFPKYERTIAVLSYGNFQFSSPGTGCQCETAMSAHKYERTIAVFSYENLHFVHRAANIHLAYVPKSGRKIQEMSCKTLVQCESRAENQSEIDLAFAFNREQNEVLHDA